MKDSSLPWYCETNRDHCHQSQWESENCSELYHLWQAAHALALEYIGEAMVEAQVNAILGEAAQLEG